MTTKRNSKEEAYKTIQALILSTQIRPGETVTENALSTQLGISRTPVREALTQLEQEGLIVSKNGRKRVYALTIREVKEIFDIKISLESAIVKWATERAKEENIQELRRIIDEMKAVAINRPENENEREQYLSQWLAKDRELHEVIFRMAGNKKAEEFIKKLNAQWHRLRVALYALEGRIVNSAEEHEGFVRHIIHRKPEAAEMAMQDHLENLKQELIKAMQLFHYPEV
ncbi:MAG: GntR family transcriptional regulator [Bacteroidia bacterium]|nr:GntR family transcriptional regulator [Bacteroidia bacterium]